MKLPHLQEVRGKTLGIVGFGEIGTEVAKRARAFEMEVVYSQARAVARLAWTSTSACASSPLDDLLAHVRLRHPARAARPGTDKLIGARELA